MAQPVISCDGKPLIDCDGKIVLACTAPSICDAVTGDINVVLADLTACEPPKIGLYATGWTRTVRHSGPPGICLWEDGYYSPPWMYNYSSGLLLDDYWSVNEHRIVGVISQYIDVGGSNAAIFFLHESPTPLRLGVPYANQLICWNTYYDVIVIPRIAVAFGGTVTLENP